MKAFLSKLITYKPPASEEGYELLEEDREGREVETVSREEYKGAGPNENDGAKKTIMTA